MEDLGAGVGGQQVYVLHAEGEIRCGETQREMEVQGVCVWGVCAVLVKVGREGFFEMRIMEGQR